MAGNLIPNAASTLRPAESVVQIEKSLRAAAAAAGVRRPTTEQRTTEFEPMEVGEIVIASEESDTSSAAPETGTGVFLLTRQLMAARPVPAVVKPCSFPRTKDEIKAEVDDPRNSKIKAVELFLRYWVSIIEESERGP